MWRIQSPTRQFDRRVKDSNRENLVRVIGFPYGASWYYRFAITREKMENMKDSWSERLACEVRMRIWRLVVMNGSIK